MTTSEAIAGSVAVPATPPQPPPPATGSFAASLAAQLGDAGAPAPRPAARPVTLGEMVAMLPARLAFADPATRSAAPVAAASVPQAPPPGEGSKAIEAAQRYLGVPYKWGGTDPATGLDCSGFVQRVFADLGVATPRVSKDQSRAGVAVPTLAQAKPGDLVYWNGRGGRPNHIGIYAGDGQMIHAPKTGDVVRYGPVRSAPPDAIRRVA